MRNQRGRILIEPPPGRRLNSPSPHPKEERAGERRPLLLIAPHPNPLPARFSQGEGENFWWLYQDAPNQRRDSRYPSHFMPCALRLSSTPTNRHCRAKSACVTVRLPFSGSPTVTFSSSAFSKVT